MHKDVLRTPPAHDQVSQASSGHKRPTRNWEPKTHCAGSYSTDTPNNVTGCRHFETLRHDTATQRSIEQFDRVARVCLGQTRSPTPLGTIAHVRFLSLL